MARILPKTSRETVLAELENARDAAATVKEAELRATRAGARLEAEVRARDAERRRMKHRALEVARERNAVGVRHHATLVRLRDVENEARFAAAEVRRLKAELDRPKPPRDVVALDRSRARPVEDKSVDTRDDRAHETTIGEDEEEGADDMIGGRVTAPRAEVPAIVDWTPEPERVTVVIEVREPPPPPPPPPPVVEERVVLCIVVVDPEPTPPPVPSVVESLAVDAGCPKQDVVEAGVEGGDESVVTVTLTAEPPPAGRTPSKVASKVEALRKSRRFTRSGRHVERQFSATTKMMRKRRE